MSHFVTRCHTFWAPLACSLFTHQDDVPDCLKMSHIISLGQGETEPEHLPSRHRGAVYPLWRAAAAALFARAIPAAPGLHFATLPLLKATRCYTRATREQPPGVAVTPAATSVSQHMRHRRCYTPPNHAPPPHCLSNCKLLYPHRLRSHAPSSPPCYM